MLDFHKACTTLFSVLKFRGYSPRFLRKIKSETLNSLKTQHRSSKCNQSRCKACYHIEETAILRSTKGHNVPLKSSLTCHSKSLIYVIKCKNCNLMYVGETSRTLRQRLTEHKSNIKNLKDVPISNHFNNVCKDINYLSIIPVETVEKIADSESLEFEDIIELLLKEQNWIKKLKTDFPTGMNLRKEIPPPVPFILKYNDQTQDINKIVCTFHNKIQNQQFKTFKRHSLTVGSKRNKNLRDQLVYSSLR